MQAVAARRYWGWVLTLFGILVIAQVAWWGWNFLGQTDQIAELKKASLALAAGHPADASREPDPRTLFAIQNEVSRRKMMFLSEASFFLVASCWALYMLHRTLRREERSQALQRRFIEMVSHESKTPLTALKLRLEDLREQLSDIPVASEVDGALQEVTRLSAALDKVLHFNRSESEKLNLQPIAVEAVIDSVLRRLTPFFRVYGAVVEVDQAPGGNTVLGDRGSIETSLQCLLENAILHNPGNQRHVRVRVVRHAATVGIQVEDNGPGIRDSETEAVFERFARGTQSAQVPGTGLGLYIARRIAVAHRGSLVLSKTSSSGSLFELNLQAVPA